ncbi:hypothetical protein [Gracilibacillus thailandensis]|uniref:Uncharacterized protein n=1 Tax=Gracilibacillus thailandensis TaxID=563735 RepID=A0A6N7R4Y8_9BACI|nr:hypothetical protein [Gracilibacillus thailandensis]MRI68302.1 hypothetical protein [Gracilibacillus thailandensis]
MSKIHDSKILKYQIDFEYSKIEMIVEYDQDEQVKILFKDFFAFHFENQLFGSILFDIVEGDIDSFVLENKELLDKEKDYLWPMDYECVEDLINYIEENSYHYYKIYASYGLNGWILSKGVLFEE